MVFFSYQQKKMALTADSHALDYEPISSLLISTLLSALTILVSVLIRDTIVSGMSIFIPTDLTKKFVFTAMITLFFLFITVLLAWLAQDKVK